MRHSSLRFYNMHVTTAISVMLVLLLIGGLVVMLLSSNALVNRIRENMALTVVMTQDCDTTSQARMEQLLDAAPYCKDYRFVSKTEALEEHISLLGEDPSEFLGYNPLSDSYELHPTAQYAQADSVEHIAESLSQLVYVDKVVYQRDVLQLISHNFTKAAWALLAVELMLLLIAITLIINTIRLQIYAKRFLIRTMTLVGATSWVVRRPFIARYMRMGVVASLLALIILGALVYYVTYKMHIVLFALNWVNIAIVAGSVLLCGLLITTLAALFSTGRYIRMDADTMHRI